MSSIKSLLLLFALTVHTDSAHATSPMFGATMSVVIAQQMLAAPPLPSLEGGVRTVAPQYGIVLPSSLSIRSSSASTAVFS